MKKFKFFTLPFLIVFFAIGIAWAQNTLNVTNLTDGSENIPLVINYTDQTSEEVLIIGTESPAIDTEGRTVGSVTINGVTCFPGGTETVTVGSSEIQFSLSNDAKGVVIDNVSG